MPSLPLSLLVAALFAGSAGLALADEMAKTDKGCLVYNWNAQRTNPSFTWSGACKQGYASGYGVLLSFVDGKLFSTTEGSMDKGRFNGHAVIRWASGAKYDGELRQSALTGYARYEGDDGRRWEGTYQDGRRMADQSQPAANAPGTVQAPVDDDSGATVSGVLSVLGGVLSVLGALSSGIGQGLSSTSPARSAQWSSVGKMLSQGGARMAKPAGSANAGGYSNASLPSGGPVALSAEVQAVDLSGGCQAAQQKGEAYIQRIGEAAKASQPAICESAEQMRKVGEMAVRVADACHEIPTWPQFREQGLQTIREAEQTMAGSCSP